MSLFIRQSKTSELQKRLNCEQGRSHGAALAEPQEKQEAAENKPLFKGSKKPGVEVDLFGGWVKP